MSETDYELAFKTLHPLVKACRYWQRSYFKTRSQSDLCKAKDAERRLDDYLQQLAVKTTQLELPL